MLSVYPSNLVLQYRTVRQERGPGFYQYLEYFHRCIRNWELVDWGLVGAPAPKGGSEREQKLRSSAYPDWLIIFTIDGVERLEKLQTSSNIKRNTVESHESLNGASADFLEPAQSPFSICLNSGDLVFLVLSCWFGCLSFTFMRFYGNHLPFNILFKSFPPGLSSRPLSTVCQLFQKALRSIPNLYAHSPILHCKSVNPHQLISFSPGSLLAFSCHHYLAQSTVSLQF